MMLSYLSRIVNNDYFRININIAFLIIQSIKIRNLIYFFRIFNFAENFMIALNNRNI